MTQTKRKPLLSGRWTRWGFPLLFFLAVFLLYLTLMLDPYFTDEQDVFYGGYNVVMSGDIYGSYVSQHMPFSYYMAAVPALLGARTVYQFRLGFYVMMSLLWTGIYLRHRKHFPAVTLVSLPFLYVFQLHLQEYATTMISDHWQGIGLAMVLLEALRYSREHHISAGMAASVSLGIVLSFGTTFLSAYPLLILFLGVAAMQAAHLRKHREEIPAALREDARLVGICLLPFAALLGWYAVSGNLSNFFGGAYTLNTEIYSRYIGGMGTQPGSTFLKVVPNWLSHLRDGVSALRTSPLTGIQTLLQAVAIVACGLRLGRRRPLAGVTLVLSCIYAGVRVFDGFHGGPYIAMTCVPMAWLLGDSLEALRQRKTAGTVLRAAYSLACLIFFLAPSVTNVRHLYHVPRFLRSPAYSDTNRDMLEILTDPGDTVHVGDISFTSEKIMTYGLRLDPCTLGSSCPWFYEFYGARELAELKARKTPVLLLDADGELWGYAVRDYAADLVAYVEENYVMLEQDLYVHRDALPEAQRRLREAGYGKVGTLLAREGSEMGEMLWSGETDSQFFPAEGSEMLAVWLQTASYTNNSRVGLTLTLLEAGSESPLAACYVPAGEMRDLRYTRFPLRAPLVPGKAYELRFTADETDGGQDTRLHLYHSAPGTAGPDTYAIIDGEQAPYSLAIQIEYAVDESLNILGAQSET